MTEEKDLKNQLSNINWRTSILYGFASGLGTYITILALYVIEGADIFNSQYFDINPINMAGVLFFNAHNVPVNFNIQGRFQDVTVNFIHGVSELSTTGVASPEVIPGIIWFLVPIAWLVFGGYRAGRKTDTNKIKTGGSILAGYLLFIILALIIASFTFVSSNQFVSISVTVKPLTTNAILIAGIIYPLLFGSIGGKLSQS